MKKKTIITLTLALVIAIATPPIVRATVTYQNGPSLSVTDSGTNYTSTISSHPLDLQSLLDGYMTAMFLWLCIIGWSWIYRLAWESMR